MAVGRFLLTEETLHYLKDQGLRGDLLDSVRVLVGESYSTEQELLEALYRLRLPPDNNREAALILRGADNHFKQAISLLVRAFANQIKGDIEKALSLYQESLTVFPTAEGHTYRAWALSLLERYQEAIDECRQAIELDPDFGNPYNDIGSYYIAQRRYDEAIGWLEKAIRASRYKFRHYPHLSLGRIYEMRGDPHR
ncbi:MAG: tetratricopeptide repeat protein, partial [Deltaproteobacteria bacterium]|nr:tetratricopeptide repeat protein [Deltaproteobacteria bacterium]